MNVFIAQGEGFDSTYVFDTEEARDDFLKVKGGDTWSGQNETMVDSAFVYTVALEELRDPGHEIHVYLNERGVNFARLTGPQAINLFEWWSHFEAAANQADWDRYNGPALDEKARELIAAGAHFGPEPVEYDGTTYTPCESCDSLHPLSGGGYWCPAKD